MGNAKIIKSLVKTRIAFPFFANIGTFWKCQSKIGCFCKYYTKIQYPSVPEFIDEKDRKKAETIVVKAIIAGITDSKFSEFKNYRVVNESDENEDVCNTSNILLTNSCNTTYSGRNPFTFSGDIRSLSRWFDGAK
ncbi:MAG: hypothetical protein K2H86_00735, partial [Muribaculaceae bacterium]|nr:hypothetical protein [Muribaculaceae bacterium]